MVETPGLNIGEKKDISESPEKLLLPMLNVILTITHLLVLLVTEDLKKLLFVDFVVSYLTLLFLLEENFFNSV